jgi:hypothetical protein
MSFREQVASDFEEVAAELGTEATIGGRQIRGVLTESDGTMSLIIGGLEQSVTARFRYNPGAFEGFIPDIRAAVTVQHRGFYVGGINRAGTHGLVTLDLVT